LPLHILAVFFRKRVRARIWDGKNMTMYEMPSV